MVVELEYFPGATVTMAHKSPWDWRASPSPPNFPASSDHSFRMET